MSPELFDTERLHDEDSNCVDPFAVDVWSLGVTILELVMGHYPLLPPGRGRAGQRSRAPYASASHPRCRMAWRGQSFVAACLQKDHRKRLTVAKLLVHPFVAGRDVVVSRRALREVIELRCS